MNTTNTFLFGLLILFVTVTSEQSIKCYDCLACNDPFNNNGIATKTCTGSCKKAKVNGVVIRSCSDVNGGDKCEEKDDIHACSCTSDLCNSASGFSVSFPVVCISAIILFLGVF
ncbi:uncharacterized protein LOC132743801 isoform X2 [Ruditapes philippinarum]|uniref:uncharacterized protein LOC132743801 isoform X2 n=1 Tax=Ruditapes philippinarum TaxID=129788 RepID=UPI00295BD14B|nr:uncharacterized protein LOC132743801 isoform X2 [Ruditapes philippinarum]